MVVRLDRLARPVSHLVAVIKQLEAQSAHFRSLCDPIDTQAIRLTRPIGRRPDRGRIAKLFRKHAESKGR